MAAMLEGLVQSYEDFIRPLLKTAVKARAPRGVEFLATTWRAKHAGYPME